MSESVFVGLCSKIGTPQQVAMRRDVVDIDETVKRQGKPNNNQRYMMSGSRREGFRLTGSDVDRMFWPIDHQVIWDRRQFQNVNGKTMIFGECSISPPGFALLQILTPPWNRDIFLACFIMKRRAYISSSAYKKVMCSKFQISTFSGPCGSGNVVGVDFDNAYCLASDFWPPAASLWIERCHVWPPAHVVVDIVQRGCHLVPVGHPLGHYQSKEWRISFSLAEQKLVYSMNHCQFLTYGLLKLFLKEVIICRSEDNGAAEDNTKLLCSYHMKTVVFWVIQENTIPCWSTHNLLECFWICFKVILKCVYEGVCPNFFIPQNNMFLVKIYGEAQNRLFLWLHSLYTTGMASLLRSPSIRSHIVQVLCNPRRSVCIDERYLTSEIEFDIDLFSNLTTFDLRNAEFQKSLKYLRKIEQLIISPASPYEIVMLQKMLAATLHLIAFMLHTEYTGTRDNKWMYAADKMSCNMLKATAKFGLISDMLYIAMYYYKTFRYKKAISVIEMTKARLSQPHVMHWIHVDVESYIAALGGQSWSTKMRKAVVHNIMLLADIPYVNELMLELQCTIGGQRDGLMVPPHVLMHMLDFLCSRHVDSARAQTALDALYTLVNYDEGKYVPVHLKDISWQILGICQQISGPSNLEAALCSYQRSLRYEFNKIQIATLTRILGFVIKNKSHPLLVSRGT
ncbi:uncharacterized protein LOC134237539 [Saccostrea cucullata]|uniref:uncharacterized protein LOC134237539 n=1 Tax=Saccostrea cuccullata TaxID=36930 RepID=UPI002ED13E99